MGGRFGQDGRSTASSLGNAHNTQHPQVCLACTRIEGLGRASPTAGARRGRSVIDQYGKGPFISLVELDTGEAGSLTRLAVLHCPWLPSHCNFPHLQQQNPSSNAAPTRIRPRSGHRSPSCAPRPETCRVQPEPLFSLINWMPTQATLSHSSRVVPTGCVFKPCQARNQTCKRRRRGKKVIQIHGPHPCPLSCGGPSSPGTTLSWPRLVSHSSAEQRRAEQLNSIHAAACKHGRWSRRNVTLPRVGRSPPTINVHVPTGRSSGRVWPD